MNIETPNVSNTGKYCDLVRTNVIIGHTCSLTSNSIKCISARILHSSMKGGGGAPVGNMYCVCNTLRMRYVDFSETGFFFFFYSNTYGRCVIPRITVRDQTRYPRSRMWISRSDRWASRR